MPTSNQTSRSRPEEYYIRTWSENAKAPGTCRFALEHEDLESGALIQFYVSECTDEEGEYDDLGFKNCDKPKVTFLGLRDIGEFKNSFGIQLMCDDPYNGMLITLKGEQYVSIKEVWFHKDSNHYRKRVQEARTSYFPKDIEENIKNGKKQPFPCMCSNIQIGSL